jgi:hypothetical protein
LAPYLSPPLAFNFFASTGKAPMSVQKGNGNV